jgi:hypothetical protein
MEDRCRFNGILNEHNGQKLNDKLISFLLKENIYNYDKYLSPYVHLDIKESKEIGFSITYKHKYYKINPEVIDEIYLNIFEQIKTYTLNDKAEIELKLSGYIDNKKKLKYLKNEYSKATKEMSNSPYSRLYLGEKQSDYNNWKEYIISCYIEEFHIINYLYKGSLFTFKLNSSQGRFKIVKDLDLRLNIYTYEFWCACYELSEIRSYIEKKINEMDLSEIEDLSNKTNGDPKSISIPKQIALLETTGFFELDKVKKLTSDRLYHIVALAIGKDPQDKSHIRAIRGNIQVLKADSSENRMKYTSGTHLEYFTKLLE